MIRAAGDLDESPGFRRRLRVIPARGKVTAAVEDDYHCMVVALRHDGGRITRVESAMHRWPWTTCPGASATLKRTFESVLLADVAGRGEKKANCTHLHDLAVLAAAHAMDAGALRYDILVSDPVGGRSRAEIRRDGAVLSCWDIEGMALAEPESARGLPLVGLRDWIAALPVAEREPARLLQWACLIAHGRQIPMAAQSDASRMPPNCHTFQPDRALLAVRIGDVIDFSAGGREPLDGIDLNL